MWWRLSGETKGSGLQEQAAAIAAVGAAPPPASYLVSSYFYLADLRASDATENGQHRTAAARLVVPRRTASARRRGSVPSAAGYLHVAYLHLCAEPRRTASCAHHAARAGKGLRRGGVLATHLLPAPTTTKLQLRCAAGSPTARAGRGRRRVGGTGARGRGAERRGGATRKIKKAVHVHTGSRIINGSPSNR